MGFRVEVAALVAGCVIVASGCSGGSAGMVNALAPASMFGSTLLAGTGAQGSPITLPLPKAGAAERKLLPASSANPAARPLIAVDVDETLCVTDYTSLVWGIGKDDSKPLPEAQATLQRLHGSFDIMYVTARSRSLERETRQWLSKHNFPAGRIVTSRTVGEFILQSNFKRKAFRKLRREYPNMVIGIGDKAKDGEAYRDNGMLAVIVNPWPDHDYHRDDIICRDWPAVQTFFDANRPTLSDPQRLSRQVDRGQMFFKSPNS